MKKIFALITVAIFYFTSSDLMAQNTTEKKAEPSPAAVKIVEASCGQCQFGLKGGGCNLAVRMDGKAYYVDGSSMDKHGNAHAKDGMCNAIRKAEVIGEVKKDRFVASSFKLLPAEEKK